MDTKRLNAKLLEWAGFSKIIPPEWNQNESKYLRYVFPNGEKHFLHPNLITSLDAQVKWIYPKLQIAKLRIEYFKDYWFNDNENHGYHYWTIYQDRTIVGHGEHNSNPALAFALAIEQLIDKGDCK